MSQSTEFINTNGDSGFFTWSTVNGPTSLVEGNGYFVNATNLQFTLPETAAVGDTFKITILGPGGPGTGFKINQNANQNIVVCGTTGGTPLRQSTIGIGGSVTVSGFVPGELICQTENTKFILNIGSLSPITIV